MMEGVMISVDIVKYGDGVAVRTMGYNRVALTPMASLGAAEELMFVMLLKPTLMEKFHGIRDTV